MPLPLGFLAGAALVGVIVATGRHYVTRMPKVRRWLSQGAILVDVDSAGEFARQHPRVAVSIPLEDLARRAHELGDKHGRVVVYAHSWRRGAQAAAELRGIGFGEVMNAAGIDKRDQLTQAVSRIGEAREAERPRSPAAETPVGLATDQATRD